MSTTVVSVLGGLVLAYLAVLGALWWYASRHPETLTARDALRLLPDVLRLVRRLAADPALPRGVRLQLVLLVGYLVLPIDLVPDVIPVIGYADDAIVVDVVLRSVVRAAGAEALARHWPGTPAGLGLVHRLAGLPLV